MSERKRVSTAINEVGFPEKPLLLADFVKFRKKRSWLKDFKVTLQRNLVKMSQGSDRNIFRRNETFCYGKI